MSKGYDINNMPDLKKVLAYKDIKDMMTRREVLKTLAAISAFTLFSQPLLSLALTPKPETYNGFTITTKINEIKSLSNDVVYISSEVVVNQNGNTSNLRILSYVVKTVTPDILVPNALMVIYENNTTTAVATSYLQYVIKRLPGTVDIGSFIESVSQDARDQGKYDVVRLIDIIKNALNITQAPTASVIGNEISAV